MAHDEVRKHVHNQPAEPMTQSSLASGRMRGVVVERRPRYAILAFPAARWRAMPMQLSTVQMKACPFYVPPGGHHGQLRHAVQELQPLGGEVGERIEILYFGGNPLSQALAL